MRHIAWRFVAAVELAALCASAADRPRYGGTLRVHVRARVTDADPGSTPAGAWEAKARRRILDQVFETLVRLAPDATPRAALAAGWQHEPDFRRWTFTLRRNAVFHDGTPVTAAAVCEALTRLGEGRAAVPVGESVVIRSERPAPELLAELALPRNWIVRRAGAVHGSGPFRLAQWTPGRQATLAAHGRHWAGRPFLDAVVFAMGSPGRDSLLALELGRAEVVELGPAEFRRATQRGAATWVSPPYETIALEVNDPALREFLALAVDRAAIHTVLLGKQGDVTGALLPQWLSGYAFLFPSARDLARARQLAAALPKQPLTVGFDPADAAARSIAERVAVDAHEAGLPAAAAPSPRADVRVVRLRVESPEPAVALNQLGATVEDFSQPPYAAERSLIEALRLLPLFHVPDLFALSPQVRAFSWDLADVWLEARP